ncbi:GNAT family N-acetyltransferase [soil metagenome]
MHDSATAPDPHPLDNPGHGSLVGAHAHLAVRRGRALAYELEISPFTALPDDPDAADWAHLAEIVQDTGRPEASIFGLATPMPPGWSTLFSVECAQLVGTDVVGAPDPEAVRLTVADVPEMLDLVARTRPGPFQPGTIHLGTYLGIRRQGRLVAMAGERMHPPGHTEISAVCTDPEARGQGLGSRLIRAVAHGILERGETPYLHAVTSNQAALRLYVSLGFVVRRQITIAGYSPPASAPSTS